MRTMIGPVVACAVVVVLAGCAAGSEAGSGSQTATARPDNTLPSARPPVDRQLDAGAYRNRPCGLYSDEEAAALGIHRTGSSNLGPDSADCLWGQELSIRLYVGSDHLGDIYQRKTTWPTEHSTVAMTVAGQPAVRTTLPTTAYCTVAVAVNNNQGVEIHLESERADSCAQAVAVAESIVHRLGG